MANRICRNIDQLFFVNYLCFTKLFLVALLTTRTALAQTYLFARLTSEPVMHTKRWTLTGDVRIGDTHREDDSFANAIVLCSSSNFNNGACFYNQQVTISNARNGQLNSYTVCTMVWLPMVLVYVSWTAMRLWFIKLWKKSMQKIKLAAKPG